jgi:putative ABC transport system permease protein
LSPVQLWSRVRARLRGLFHRDAVAGEIREELEFHVRMRAEDYERAGTPRRVAIEHARRRFGNVALWQDLGYDVRGGGVMETVFQDLRFAWRLLLRQPGFSLVAILTMALGIGMTTAIASVIDAAMLHPLPYPRPHELVQLSVEVPRPDRPSPSRFGPSRVDLEAIRSAPNAPVTVAMWRTIFRSPIADGPEPERLRGYEIDEHYLGLFGVAPIRGRGIQAQDTVEGAPPVVLIGYGYWQRRFGSRDEAVGQRLQLDGVSAEIIGVLPMRFYRNTAIWVPLKVTSEMAGMRGSGAVTYGRLRSGITIDEAQRELTEIVSRAASVGIKLTPGWLVRVGTLLDRETTGYWTTANILLGAVGLILLIACVNVAGLLLARGATRTHEVAIRASIGAGRGRIVRQLLTESLLLSLAGAAVGMLVAWWTLDALVANIPLPLSSNAPATLNVRILAFSLLLAVATGLSFGLAPALRLSRVRVTGALAKGNRRTGSALSRRGGQWLVGLEIALALMLITGAGLMIRSFSRLVSVDLGFQPESFVTLQATPAELKAPVFTNYYTGLVDAIRQMPDVEAVGAINHLPLMGSAMFTSVTTDTGRETSITFRQVLPGYFEALGLRPQKGRFPSREDLVSGRDVVVLTERSARALFPDGPAIGRTIKMNKGLRTAEVVGIAPELRVDGAQNVRERGYDEVFSMYRPAPDERPDALVIVVRPRSTTSGLIDRLRQTALNVGPRAIVERVRPGTDWLDDTVVTPKRRTVLLSLLGGLGLLLTLIGVFGMTAYSVARRTQEIGVRMALGARPSDVIHTMMTDVARPIALGTIAGLAGSWYATSLISTFLFQTTPTDLPTFAGATVTLLVAALLAVWIPARRAGRVDPIKSLRVE